MRVLIVDDSPIMRERLVAMLSALGEEIELVGEAQDAAEALASIRRLKPDAVVLDIQMPGGSGIDVLRRIKTDQPAPVAMILTNYPYPQYRSACAEEGAEFFFDKSTEFDKVPEVFRQLGRG